MKLLLDTQLLLWSGVGADAAWERLPPADAIALIVDPQNELYYSAASVWEVAIKYALAKPNFRVDPYVFRRALLDRGYREIPVTSEHGARVSELPKHHKDPFDRLLVAQAMVEGITLLTVDGILARYPGPVRRV